MDKQRRDLRNSKLVSEEHSETASSVVYLNPDGSYTVVWYDDGNAESGPMGGQMTYSAEEWAKYERENAEMAEDYEMAEYLASK